MENKARKDDRPEIGPMELSRSLGLGLAAGAAFVMTAMAVEKFLIGALRKI